jgi:hypothetical protein
VSARAKAGAAALALVAALLLVGCGGSGESSEAEVRKTVTAFIAAIHRNDLAAACEEIDPQLSAFLESGGHGCAAGLRKDLHGGDDELGSLRIARVSVNGRAAVVTFRGSSGVSFEVAQSSSGDHWQLSNF